jgi:RND family efflux transporter MFP subunit
MMVTWLKSLKLLSIGQIFLVLVVMAGTATGVYEGYTWLNKPKVTAPSINVQQVAVRLGNVTKTLTISGSLTYSDSQTITWGAPGTIKEVNVVEGDIVTQGQLLAKFDDASIRSLQSAVLQAQVALNNAQANLDKAQQTELSQAQTDVITAQIAVNTAQTNLDKASHPYSDTDILQAQADIINAQAAINTAQANLDKANHPYTENDVVQAQAAIINAQTAVETAQTALDKANHIYTDDEWTAANQVITDAQKALNTTFTKTSLDISSAADSVATAYATYQTTPTTKNYNAWQQAITNFNTVEANANKTLQAAYDVLDKARAALAAMQAGPDPDEVMLAQAKLGVANTTLATARTNLATMQAGPDPLTIQQKQILLTIAQNNLVNAKTNLATIQAGPDPLTIQQKQILLTIAQNNLKQAQTTLANLQAGSNINLKKIDVQNAQAALDNAQKAALLTTLVAPSAGMISVLNVKVAQAVNAATTICTLVNPSLFSLTASVNQLDITQIKLNQSASVAIDALSGQKLSGRVSAITRSGSTQQGVTTYRVSVAITSPEDVQLLAGMSASASVIVQEAKNVLLVPNRAVGGTSSSPTVNVLLADGLTTETRAVTTGLSDSSYTEIKTGVNAGEIVLVTIAVKATSTSKATATTSTGVVATQIPGGQIPGPVIVTQGPGGQMPGLPTN